MALGNGNNYRNNNYGNGSKEQYDPTYYSRIKIKNPFDNMYIGFSFWRGILKISIIDSRNQQNSNNNNVLAYISLSPTKARLFAEAVNRVINTENDEIYGVDTGISETKGFIAIGRDKGVPFIFIAKVTPSGEYESAQRFNFTTEYNYLLKVHNISKLNCQKEYRNDVELNQLHDILEDFARSSSGAYGAAFYDIGRYEASKVVNIIKNIAGITEPNNSSRNNNSNDSFFNNIEVEYSDPSRRSSSNSERQSSIRDLESELE